MPSPPRPEPQCSHGLHEISLVIAASHKRLLRFVSGAVKFLPGLNARISHGENPDEHHRFTPFRGQQMAHNYG